MPGILTVTKPRNVCETSGFSRLLQVHVHLFFMCWVTFDNEV